MTILDFEVLSTVIGGDNTRRTTATVKAFGAEGSVTTETREGTNDACRREVREACNSTNTHWFWGRNKKAADKCFLDTFPACPPNSGS